MPYAHGHAKRNALSPTYRSWQRMWARCQNRNRHAAHRYIKRGIAVCNRWKSFAAFLADMGERPEGMTLERKNNNLGYNPGNCKWETLLGQARNKHNTKMTFEAATQVALRRLRGEKRKTIAADFAISESHVDNISSGRQWKDAFKEAKSIFQIS
jgi:hypothetical protein